MPAVQVSELQRSYGPVHALRGISFEVMAGEIFGLLGPNGAGKTTTLEILEGYREPTSGEATVLGSAPGSRHARSRTGTVLQSSAADPYLTVSESVRMYSEWFPRRRDVGEVLEQAGLSDEADTRARKLSGGQLRRLDLALALAGDPELLFLDEPTTGFDPAAKRDAWETIRNLAAGGRTVLLTTHNLEEAQALCDRVGIISAGHLVAEGTPDTLTRASGVNIRVSLPEPPPAEAGEFTSLGGGLYEAAREEPSETLQLLTGWAIARGITLESLEVGRASLEDVYLQLTEADE